ncbi:hypothetical protein D3C79_744910 [compost metagenome]
MNMPPKQRLHLWITLKPAQQFVSIAQTDRCDPGAADIHRLMVTADQAMAPPCRHQRIIEQRQLCRLKQPMGRTLHRRIEHDDTPGADIGYRLHQLRRHLGHDPGFIMITRQPARRYGEVTRQITERLIRGSTAILRKITGAQQQIDTRLFAAHLGDHMAQAVARAQPQQRARRVGEQVSVSQLHHAYGCLRGVWVRHRPSPRGIQHELWRGIGCEQIVETDRHHISAHTCQLVTTRQAVAQPFPEKQIELGLFIRLVHGLVGIRVDAAQAPGMLGADHFGHARIVVHLHLQVGHR